MQVYLKVYNIKHRKTWLKYKKITRRKEKKGKHFDEW